MTETVRFGYSLELDFLCCNQVTQLQETCTVELLGKLEIHKSYMHFKQYFGMSLD
jgi:hypothetical protein